MARTQNPNLEIIEIAAQALGPLCDELVFLGGCATALLITDSAAPPVRATRDVDTLAEIGSAAVYRELERRLRQRGFEVDSPIYRWTGHGIILGKIVETYGLEEHVNRCEQAFPSLRLNLRQKRPESYVFQSKE